MVFGALFILFIIFFLILNYRFTQSNYYKNISERDHRFALRNQVVDNLKVVNLGSTVGRFAFCYHAQVQGANLAMGPQTLEYDFKVLMQMKETLQKGCIVLICLPPFVFCAKEFKKKGFDEKYYFVLHEYQKNRIRSFFHTRFPILFAGKNALHAIIDSKYKNYIDINYSSMNEETSREKAKQMLKGWLTEFQINIEKGIKYPEKLNNIIQGNVNILNDMISYCFEQKWLPILVSTPISETLNELLDGDLIQRVLYDQVVKINHTVDYFDYREHAEFQKKFNLFIDGNSWLTKIGREQFMEILLSEINIDHKNF